MSKNRGWLVLESLWTDNSSHAPVETGSRSCKSQVSDLSILYRAEAAYNNSESLGVEFSIPGRGNFRAATWISPVAEFAVKALKDFYGIDFEEASQSLNLIGQSLGVLVNAEMGGQLTFQEFRRRSGLFSSTTDTAIIAKSEFIALVEDTTIEEIQKPEYFVVIDEEELKSKVS